MRDSMHILDQLRQRGYEPREHPRDGQPFEEWFDRKYPGATLRVVISDDGLALFSFDPAMCMEWDARFADGTPATLVLAALDAAEREAGEDDGYRAGQLAHEHYREGQRLRHSHIGGDLAHSYYEHPEDAA